MIAVGSDFSGVGAFNQALKRLGIDYREKFACDMDKYARETFIHNYGEPEYYPKNVYEREIPKKSLDIYMTSPPCQSFSLAGKRLGKDDKRGVLFFNSHEFIQVNKPRFFIFENVKGLLSDDSGKTFSEWTQMLGGKSINGTVNFFPMEDAVPYHIYHQVLNAKDYNIPQNRERVFIIGIRDDQDNDFSFPAKETLTKRLKDVLEEEVDEKYFLSEDNIDKLIQYDKRQRENGNGFRAKFHSEDEVMSALKVGGAGCDDLIKVGTLRTHKDGEGFREIKDGNCPTIPARAREDGSGQPVIKIGSKDVVIQLNDSKESGGKQPYQQNRMYDVEGLNPALNAGQSGWGGNIINTQIIRRLTPRECFRLMDFPETFTWPVSDSQAYKQAGNSICVGVLAKIISKLKL